MSTLDAGANRSTMMFDQPFAAISAPQPGSAQASGRPGRPKRPRASDTASMDPAKIQEKREKARERQRRKRERDRRRESENAAVLQMAAQGYPVVQGPVVAGPSNPLPVQQDQHLAVQQQQQPPQIMQQPLPPQAQPQQVQQAPPPTQLANQQNVQLTQEEINRREKVRAAARERQRKHRALVKQKKMAELGLAMGGDGVGGIEEMHYTLGPDGHYQPVLPPPHPHHQELGPDPPFPQGHTGGQTFASTLLLSFSCSPLLKQHLLRTLHMTNEELASLEPILSSAWDQWDHARRIHYAEQAAKANVEQQQNGASGNGGNATPFVPPPTVDGQAAQASNMNDFRARFHRPLTAPSPFRNATSAIAPGPPGIIPPPPGQAPNHIDPALGANQQQQQQNGVQQPVNGVNGSASNADSGTADGEGDADMVDGKDEEVVSNSLNSSNSA